MKIITVIGARPQFVKSAVVSIKLQQENIEEIIVHTGQHFDANMSDIFFNELEIQKPKYHLGVHSGLHGDMTGRMLSEIEKVLLVEKPDILMVYGDTNSTLAGALAAVKLHIPVAHIESGLRSFNILMPEEVNRVLTDRVSKYLFTPTETGINNLKAEGFDIERIFLTGDVMYDAALHFSEIDKRKHERLARYNLNPKKYILATIHRAENTNDLQRLKVIFSALDRVAQEISVILPLHPRTRNVLSSNGIETSNIQIIDPVGYLDMIALERNAKLIVTDSGGVQKEAYFFEVACVTLRDETEWIELVDYGWNVLAPPLNIEEVINAIESSIGKKGHPDMALYGDGNSSQKIVKTLKDDN